MANSNRQIGETSIPTRTGRAIPKDKRATSLQFLLECIDGVSTVQELAWLNGIPLEKLQKELQELVSLGTVELKGSESDVNSRITTRSDIIDLNKLEEVESSYNDREYTSQVETVSDRSGTHEMTDADEQQKVTASIDVGYGDLPIPTLWGVEFSEYSLEGKWKRLESVVDGKQLRLLVFYLEHLGDLTHYQLLNIERDASGDDIRRAALKLKKFFEPWQWERFQQEKITNAAKRVHKAISQAYVVLRDKESREGYDMALQYLDES